MAKIERSINEDFDQLLSNIENGILNSSISATLEDASDFQSGTARCSVRIFERYSYAGGNRVSLNITLFQNGEDPVQLSAITAGGSRKYCSEKRRADEPFPFRYSAGSQSAFYG